MKLKICNLSKQYRRDFWGLCDFDLKLRPGRNRFARTERRGQVRATCMTTASATITNVQDIQPYRVAKKKVILTAQNARSDPGGLLEAGEASFLASVRASLARRLRAGPAFSPSFFC